MYSSPSFFLFPFFFPQRHVQLYLSHTDLLSVEPCNVGKSKVLLENELFTTQSRLLTNLRKKPFENIVEKGENAGNQHFLLFPQCFLPF